MAEDLGQARSSVVGPGTEDRGQPVLRAVNLAKKFRTGPSELLVFEDLNLEVAPGEMLAVVGESGAGKSTLLHLLGALDRPTGGEIYFRLQKISSFHEQELADFRNREIGFVWQFHYLLPEFTAQENVALPLRIRGTAAQESEERAAELLKEVGLGGRLRHRPGELSGGEQQRVALARALVNQPSLLLADEPTGNLDQGTGEMVFRLIEQLHGSHRLTSVLVTHNPLFARRCHRVLELREGRLREAPGDRDPVGFRRETGIG